MKKHFQKHVSIISLVLIATLSSSAQVQTCREQLRGLNLEMLHGNVETHFSPGHRESAFQMKELLEEASRFYDREVNLRPTVTLAALGPDEWPKLLDKPYGLPTLRTGPCRRGAYSGPPQYVAIMPVTAGGPIYDDWQKMKGEVSPQVIKNLKKMGLTFEDGGQVLLDFVALHELGHAYAHAMGIESLSSFFAEFTGNYFAYAFLKSTKNRRDRKTMAVLRANVSGIRPIHKSIDKFETFQSREHPPTEAWYNSVFTIKAAEIYDKKGFKFMEKVRDAFKGEKYGSITNEEILKRLEKIEPGFIKWSNDFNLQGAAN